MQSLCFWLSLFLSPLAHGFEDPVKGVVVKIIEGDALVVVDEKKLSHPIRLMSIDTPEKWQPYYSEAKTSLRRLVKGRRVTVEWSGYSPNCEEPIKSHCPKLGRVFLDGDDIGLKQIERGFAWHDNRHLEQQSTPDRSRYHEAQEKAREKKIGLWQDVAPEAPWRSQKPIRHPTSLPRKKRTSSHKPR